MFGRIQARLYCRIWDHDWKALKFHGTKINFRYCATCGECGWEA